jgi:hypothetical protein
MLRRRILEKIFKFKANQETFSFEYGIKGPAVTETEYGSYVGANQVIENINGTNWYKLSGTDTPKTYLLGKNINNTDISQRAFKAQSAYINICTYNFKTTVANQEVKFYFDIHSDRSTNNYLGATKLDSTDIWNLAVKLTELGTKEYTYTVATPGDHFIKVYFYQHNWPLNQGLLPNLQKQNYGLFRMEPYDVTRHELTYYDPNSQPVELTSYYGWRVTSKPDWIKLSKNNSSNFNAITSLTECISGINTIYIIAHGNAYAKRTGSIVLTEKYGTQKVTLSISQEANPHPYDIITSYDKLQFPQTRYPENIEKGHSQSSIASQGNLKARVIGDNKLTTSDATTGLAVSPAETNITIYDRTPYNRDISPVPFYIITPVNMSSDGTFKLNSSTNDEIHYFKTITIKKEKNYCYCDCNLFDKCGCDTADQASFKRKVDSTCESHNCTPHNGTKTCNPHCEAYAGCSVVGHTDCSCNCKSQCPEPRNCTCHTGNTVETRNCTCHTGNTAETRNCTCHAGNTAETKSCTCHAGNTVETRNCTCHSGNTSITRNCTCHAGNTAGSGSCTCHSGNTAGSGSCTCHSGNTSSSGTCTCHSGHQASGCTCHSGNSAIACNYDIMWCQCYNVYSACPAQCGCYSADASGSIGVCTGHEGNTCGYNVSYDCSSNSLTCSANYIKTYHLGSCASNFKRRSYCTGNSTNWSYTNVNPGQNQNVCNHNCFYNFDSDNYGDNNFPLKCNPNTCYRNCQQDNLLYGSCGTNCIANTSGVSCPSVSRGVCNCWNYWCERHGCPANTSNTGIWACESKGCSVVGTDTCPQNGCTTVGSYTVQCTQHNCNVVGNYTYQCNTNGCTTVGNYTYSCNTNGCTTVGDYTVACNTNNCSTVGDYTVACTKYGCTTVGNYTVSCTKYGCTTVGDYTVSCRTYNCSTVGNYTVACSTYACNIVGDYTVACPTWNCDVNENTCSCNVKTWYPHCDCNNYCRCDGHYPGCESETSREPYTSKCSTYHLSLEYVN